VLLFGGAKIVIFDFGYAVQLIHKTVKIPEFQRSRTIDKYTPPEVTQGKLTITSDIYSLGAIITDLLQAVHIPSEHE
jgi:serine/threonine protein kinase